VSKTTLWEFEKHIIKFNDHHTECRSFYFKLLERRAKKNKTTRGAGREKQEKLATTQNNDDAK